MIAKVLVEINNINVDKTFDYTASSSADTVSVINNNQINDVVNNG